jgi:hypothetical protein
MAVLVTAIQSHGQRMHPSTGYWMPATGAGMTELVVALLSDCTSGMGEEVNHGLPAACPSTAQGKVA